MAHLGFGLHHDWHGKIVVLSAGTSVLSCGSPGQAARGWCWGPPINTSRAYYNLGILYAKENEYGKITARRFAGSGVTTPERNEFRNSP